MKSSVKFLHFFYTQGLLYSQKFETYSLNLWTCTEAIGTYLLSVFNFAEAFQTILKFLELLWSFRIFFEVLGNFIKCSKLLNSNNFPEVKRNTGKFLFLLVFETSLIFMMVMESTWRSHCPDVLVTFLMIFKLLWSHLNFIFFVIRTSIKFPQCDRTALKFSKVF